MSAAVEQVASDLSQANLGGSPAAPAAVAGSDVVATEAVANRAERKARKGLQGIGLQRIPGVTRITMRRARGHLYVINNPEVYKSATADSYVVFGEGKVEDTHAQQLALQAAQQQQQQQLMQLQQQALAQGGGAGAPASEEDFSKQAQALLANENKESEPSKQEEEDEAPQDATGLQESDIELVIAQAGTSRNRAIKALKNANGDLVCALPPSMN